MDVFTPEFREGARRGIEKVRGVFMRNAPIVIGAGSGALIGHVLSPRNEPGKYRTHGAALGAGMGVLHLKAWQKKLHPRWQVSI